jgi:hypothetical protein
MFDKQIIKILVTLFIIIVISVGFLLAVANGGQLILL